jgi:hypothetical protein
MSDEQPPVPPRRINPFFRVLVVLFGISLLGLGRTLLDIGGVVGVLLGSLFLIVAVAVIVIAIGLVEWWAARRQR